MKRHELLFWIIKLPIEFFIVFFSFFIARNIREFTDLIPWVQIPSKIIPDLNFMIFALLWALLLVLVYAYLWLYNMKSSRVRQFASMIEGALFWFLLYIWCLYLSLWYLYHTELPRLTIFFALFISVFLIIIERFIIDWFQKFLLKNWKLEKTKIALLIDSQQEDIIESIRYAWIYDLVWYYNNKRIKDTDLEYLGNHVDFISWIQNRWLDEILYASSDFNNESIEKIFEYSRIYWISYKYIANSFDFTKNNTETSFINKIPVVEIKSIWLTPWGRVIKRFFDIISSWIWLLILSPVFMLVAFLEIKESGWFHIFYPSLRVGKNRKLFKMYKFRSMKLDAEKEKAELIKQNERHDGPLFKIENDPRITRLGAFLRKYDIDELPQLWNVFNWNMSLIWPRPHLPEEVALYKDYQKRVLTLKPWITGMAQSHWRHKNTFDDEVKLDIFYIENWNFLLDLKILFKTIKVVIRKEGR
ncbi:MAG: undecaprenyl-phosphate galactose phosphotransferase [uncultured bacterium (gcode 4)]|uniref:Undecaprenyl-phosphate galactose phosphotransferase n=1 Tax=uncultured bacterium (gcode 4) TaxID=1234023 RepID=K2G025_9BACT|nr:MAG: undecaprenyl-phosphate galactose phosphotransferase [uncultured bacterium (gcode 4)]